MSYTMTMDVPPKASAYIQHRGPSFRAELNSLFIAFVTTEMQRNGFEWSDSGTDVAPRMGSSFARAWGRLGVKEGELDLSRRPERLREIDFS